jgi:hypothetical protein
VVRRLPPRPPPGRNLPRTCACSLRSGRRHTAKCWKFRCRRRRPRPDRAAEETLRHGESGSRDEAVPKAATADLKHPHPADRQPRYDHQPADPERAAPQFRQARLVLAARRQAAVAPAGDAGLLEVATAVPKRAVWSALRQALGTVAQESCDRDALCTLMLIEGRRSCAPGTSRSRYGGPLRSLPRSHAGPAARRSLRAGQVRTGSCWFHKTANVPAALPRSAYQGAKKALAEIWGAEDKDHALAANTASSRPPDAARLAVFKIARASGQVTGVTCVFGDPCARWPSDHLVNIPCLGERSAHMPAGPPSRRPN